MSDAKEGYMRRALALARQGMIGNAGGPFGAVVVKDGRIVGEGFNRVTSTNDPTAHAEVVAIREACQALGTFDLSGAEIYASCEPCPMCLAAIYWARIGRIYYGNTREGAARIGFDDDHIYREFAVPMERRAIPMRRLLADEAEADFAAWTKKEDKVRY
jgi:tRNA(Arg) A34 adenosine deaminase TadA